MSSIDEPRKLILDLHRESKELEVQVYDGDTIIDILTSLEIPVDGVLVFSEGIPIPLDEKIGTMSGIKVINVASGG